MFVPKTIKDKINPQDFLNNFNEVILPQLEAYVGYGGEKSIIEIFNDDIFEEYLRVKKVSLKSFLGIIRESNSDQSLAND